MARVSVIVPNYNHEPFLKKRIDSILNQTFQDFELIILDDCSTDNSRVIIENYRNHPKVSAVVYNVKNSGSPFSQWQKGVSLAAAEYIWIAESDDFAEPMFLETLFGMITADKKLGIVFCNSNWVNEQGAIGPSLSIYNQSFRRSGQNETINLLKYNTIQNVSSTLIAAKYAKEATSGLHRYKSCGDWLFYLRILRFSDVAYSNQTLNNFRWYHNNISNSARKSGKWIREGVDIIRRINPRDVPITAGHYRAILIEWFKQVQNNSGLSFMQRVKCYYKLVLIFSRVIAVRGI